MNEKPGTVKKPQSLKSQIYERILKGVLNNNYSMDELIVESRLMNEFDVSRSPVREALIELCRDNILRSIPKAGYQIVRISAKELRDAFQMRLILELNGLELAFPKLTKEHIAELKDIAEKTDQARHRGMEADGVLSLKMQLNHQLHMRINELSGNALLHETLQKTMDILSRGIAQIMIHENEMPFPEETFHMGIVQSLEKGEFERAKEKLSRDIKTYEEEFWYSVHSV